MIIKKMLKLISLLLFLSSSFISGSYGSEHSFNLWLNDFKKRAIDSGISEFVVNNVMSDAKFIPKVIEYDRYQPEFYEDTFTYIKKRTSKKKLREGLSLYKKEKKLIDKVEEDFQVEKELLLALMGIETNFGKYLGKMDIVSSLATLSFDKRRSEFFTEELLILLKLVDKKIIKKETLFGSWAGAFGNFQFMPRTIRNYAVDYNKNKTIELKKTEDSFASAANYLNQIGWKKNQPCFFQIDLKNNIPNFDSLKIQNDFTVGIIIPDKDIIPNSETFSPAYIIFDNYEKILNWNRSLRFALAVCKLKDDFKNEI